MSAEAVFDEPCSIDDLRPWLEVYRNPATRFEYLSDYQDMPPLAFAIQSAIPHYFTNIVLPFLVNEVGVDLNKPYEFTVKRKERVRISPLAHVLCLWARGRPYSSAALQYDIVEALLNFGASPSAPLVYDGHIKRGMTPLEVMILGPNAAAMPIVIALLRHGARPGPRLLLQNAVEFERLFNWLLLPQLHPCTDVPELVDWVRNCGGGLVRVLLNHRDPNWACRCLLVLHDEYGVPLPDWYESDAFDKVQQALRSRRINDTNTYDTWIKRV